MINLQLIVVHLSEFSHRLVAQLFVFPWSLETPILYVILCEIILIKLKSNNMFQPCPKRSNTTKILLSITDITNSYIIYSQLRLFIHMPNNITQEMLITQVQQLYKETYRQSGSRGISSSGS